MENCLRLFVSVDHLSALVCRRRGVGRLQRRRSRHASSSGWRPLSPTGEPRSQAYGTIAAGQRLTRFLTAGGPDDADICHAGTDSDPASVRGFHVWKLQVEALSVSPTQTTLQLQSSRTRGSAFGLPAEAGDTRTFTLGPTDYQIWFELSLLATC